jgi:dihydroorotate dehydrogenase
MAGNAHRWARLEGLLRPWLVRLPAPLTVAVYSMGRRRFLGSLAGSLPRSDESWQPPEEQARTLWGLRFRSPLGNGAGMFKNGEGLSLAVAQGAGWYLAGTTTGRPWPGNRWGGRRLGIPQPFAPYPLSAAASNWLGLPNDGTPAVAERLAGYLRQRSESAGEISDFPIGASVAATPGLEEEAALAELVEGMELYSRAGVDFLEINESCPNTPEGRPCSALGGTALAHRLETLAERFLRPRRRSLPVLVKLSCDTAPEQVPELLELLLKTGFDGVNFGNTSADYDALWSAVAPAERRLYEFFTRRFGGGVSGRPLRRRSLELVRRAAVYLKENPPDREFHIVRTGGIEGAEDVAESLASGASLCGWYTGYFEGFARWGHEVYRRALLTPGV